MGTINFAILAKHVNKIPFRGPQSGHQQGYYELWKLRWLWVYFWEPFHRVLASLIRNGWRVEETCDCSIQAFDTIWSNGPSVEYVYDIYWLTGLVLFSLMPYVKLTFFQQKRSKGVAKNLPINLTRELCFERSLHNFSHTLILATFLTPFHFNPFLLNPYHLSTTMTFLSVTKIIAKAYIVLQNKKNGAFWVVLP